MLQKTKVTDKYDKENTIITLKIVELHKNLRSSNSHKSFKSDKI